MQPVAVPRVAHFMTGIPKARPGKQWAAAIGRGFSGTACHNCCCERTPSGAATREHVMSPRTARTLRIALPAVLIATAVVAGTAPQVHAQLHLPRLRPSKTPPPKADEKADAKTPAWRSLKLSKLDP